MLLITERKCEIRISLVNDHISHPSEMPTPRNPTHRLEDHCRNDDLLSCGNDRSFHLEEILRTALKVFSQASDRLDPIRPDYTVGQQVVLYMNNQDFPDNETVDAWGRPEFHDLRKPAFELDRRFVHARRPDSVARHRRQARFLELSRIDIIGSRSSFIPYCCSTRRMVSEI